MNCEVFTENIQKYLDNEISYDLKAKMDKHMQQCGECKKLYDEEVFLDNVFKDALSVDDIEFKSSKENIMKNIDKNKYKKKPVIKLKNYVKRNYRKYTPAVAAAFAVIVVFSAWTKAGFNKRRNMEVNMAKQSTKAEAKETSKNDLKTGMAKEEINKKPISEKPNNVKASGNAFSRSIEKKESTQRKISIQQQDIKEENKSENMESNPNEHEVKPAEDVRTEIVEDLPEDFEAGNDKKTTFFRKKNDMKSESHLGESNVEILEEPMNIAEEAFVTFEKIKLDDKTRQVFKGKWLNSLDNGLSACIEGKIDNLHEEGIDTLYIRDEFSSEKWIFEIKNNVQGKVPKSIEWYDNSNILVTVGREDETLSIGSEVYLVNAENGQAKLVYKTSSDKEQVVTASRNKDGYILMEVKVFNEDYSKFKIQKKVIKDF